LNSQKPGWLHTRALASTPAVAAAATASMHRFQSAVSEAVECICCGCC
jgi:hypothetical protein